MLLMERIPKLLFCQSTFKDNLTYFHYNTQFLILSTRRVPFLLKRKQVCSMQKIISSWISVKWFTPELEIINSEILLMLKSSQNIATSYLVCL